MRRARPVRWARPVLRARPVFRALLPCLLTSGLQLAGGPARGGEWSGYVALEGRWFPSPPVAADQADHRHSLSLSFQPEYYDTWDEGNQSLTFTPFLRYDQRDSERTHVDLRELYWQQVGRGWELSLGLRKLFWGVTESQHLVDIINQTDLVEDPDGEQKLGQPMVNLSLIRAWGTLDLLLLTGFRERTFPGEDGRLRTSPRIDPDRARYESAAEQGHVDWAVRWSHAIGDWDLGLAHFSGTGREPRLLPGLDELGEPVLLPLYEQIEQTSLDIQATKGGWLWKLEAISRRSRRERFHAAIGGFEYTFGDLQGSGIDLGVLAEYLYDERDERATTPFENDLFLATRLAFNDVQDTNLLAGGTVDLDTGAIFLDIQGNRRLGQSWRLNLKLRAFANVPETDLNYTLHRDDYLQLELARYF
jgi:hypothetical protein